MKKSCGERKKRESWKLTWVGVWVRDHYASSNPTKHKRLTLVKLRTSISVHRAMHRAALGHLPLLRLAMHTLILLSKFKQRTKNDTKKYGRKTHAVPIPVVPFRFFPGTTRLPVLVVHFFVSQSNLQGCTTCPPLSSTSSSQCTRLFWFCWTSRRQRSPV